jgi:hypothetical protein
MVAIVSGKIYNVKILSNLGAAKGRQKRRSRELAVNGIGQRSDLAPPTGREVAVKGKRKRLGAPFRAIRGFFGKKSMVFLILNEWDFF